MYTGLVTAYLGAALRAGTWWPLPLAPLCVLATDRLVIRPEEAYLADRFGPAYARYRARVRRWRGNRESDFGGDGRPVSGGCGSAQPESSRSMSARPVSASTRLRRCANSTEPASLAA